MNTIGSPDQISQDVTLCCGVSPVRQSDAPAEQEEVWDAVVLDESPHSKEVGAPDGRVARRRAVSLLLAMGASLLAAFSMFALTFALIALVSVFNAILPNPNMLGQLSARCLWVVLIGVGCGTYLVRTRSRMLGRSLLAIGLVAMLVPSVTAMSHVLFGFATKSVNRESLVIVERGDQRVATHPQLGFSFPLTDDMRHDEKLALAVAQASRGATVYVYGSESSVVICLLSSPLHDLSVDPGRFVEGFLDRAHESKVVDRVQRTGDGMTTDVRLKASESGTHVFYRVMMTPGAGDSFHALTFSLIGFEDASAVRYLDACRAGPAH